MKNKKIIVISGKQFSGKDTVANIFCQCLDGFTRIGLADALKLEFGKAKDLTLNEIERNKPLYRAELIDLGNKRRNDDPDYWIKKVMETEGNLIISDIRLIHELKTFKKLNAIAIRVESSREHRSLRGHLVQETDQTETALDGYKEWDFVIENNGSCEELQKRAVDLAKQIKKSLYCNSL